MSSPTIAACPTFNFLNYTADTVDSFKSTNKIEWGQGILLSRCSTVLN